MNSKPIAGILTVLTLASCAPVASSVPKVRAIAPRTNDSLVTQGKTADGMKKRVQVVPADKYERFEKKLDADYKIVKFGEKDAEFSALKELNAIQGLELDARGEALDVVVVFVTKSEEKELSEEGSKGKIKFDLTRGKKEKFDLSVSAEGEAGLAWSTIKGDLVSMVIAYREIKAKN